MSEMSPEAVQLYNSAPPTWRALLAELNGRPLDGTLGIRDVDAPCYEFEPYGQPNEHSPGEGACETDGHYLCVECKHISLRAVRRRTDRCEDCGMGLGAGEICAECDVVTNTQETT